MMLNMLLLADRKCHGTAHIVNAKHGRKTYITTPRSINI